jgi:zinc/manganese transport system substrate-binding protein
MLRKGAIFGLVVILSACAAPDPAAAPTPHGKTIVVTYSVLGSLVRDLVGDRASVLVPMPNGQDPHEWEPSAKNIETIMHADLVVQNGLGLEGGMEKTLAEAKSSGVKFFTASDHITVRHVGEGEGLPGGDPDQAAGAEDPHLWMDPVAMKQVVDALAAQIKTELAIDLSDRAKDLDRRLDTLDKEVAADVASLPEANRKLVTGHESMGYFAERYHFKLIGALIPSLTTDAETSASDLAAIKGVIAENKVRAIFTELGTPKSVADTIGQESGVKVVELTTHALPADGSYFTFLRNTAQTIVDALK